MELKELLGYCLLLSGWEIIVFLVFAFENSINSDFVVYLGGFGFLSLLLGFFILKRS